MASVKKVQSVAAFMAAINASALEVFTSKAGNKYATNNGELCAWVAKDFDYEQPAVVFTMQEGENTWNFIANGEETPREAEFTL